MQPLHAAASTGADEVCWLLVEHGAEVGGGGYVRGGKGGGEVGEEGGEHR